MLIATMDHEIEKQAKIVGYFLFPDREEFTNLVITRGELSRDAVLIENFL